VAVESDPPDLTLRASTFPSAERITPRLIRCSSSSPRRFSGLSRSASASNTVQRDVNPTSSANSTTTRP
jgi:hypothetical protein